MRPNAHFRLGLVAAATVIVGFVGLPGSRAAAQVAYDPSMQGVAARVELVSAAQLGPESDHPGCWEYVYDMFGGNQSWTRFVTLCCSSAKRFKSRS